MAERQSKTRRIRIGLATMVLLTPWPASAADEARPAIEAANEKWEAAASRGDGPGVAALYTAHAQLLPAHSDVVSGTQAIADFFQAAFDSGITGASLVTVEVESHGNTAHEVGKFEFRGAGGKVVDHGKYIVIWKKEGGSWKLHRDIWTTSVVTAEPTSASGPEGVDR